MARGRPSAPGRGTQAESARGPAASVSPAGPSGRAVPGTARRPAERSARRGRPRARWGLTSAAARGAGRGCACAGAGRARARAERNRGVRALPGQVLRGPAWRSAGGRTWARLPGQEVGEDPPVRRAPSYQKGDSPRPGPRPAPGSVSQRGSGPLPPRRDSRVRGRSESGGSLVTSSGCWGHWRKLETLESAPGAQDTQSLCAAVPAATSRALCRNPRGLRETPAK